MGALDHLSGAVEEAYYDCRTVVGSLDRVLADAAAEIDGNPALQETEATRLKVLASHLERAADPFTERAALLHLVASSLIADVDALVATDGTWANRYQPVIYDDVAGLIAATLDDPADGWRRHAQHIRDGLGVPSRVRRLISDAPGCKRRARAVAVGVAPFCGDVVTRRPATAEPRQVRDYPTGPARQLIGANVAAAARIEYVTRTATREAR